MNDKHTFEEKLQRIDDIAALLQSGQLSLDESVDLYKEACELTDQCRKMLSDAELKIITLNRNFQQAETEET